MHLKSRPLGHHANQILPNVMQIAAHRPHQQHPGAIQTPPLGVSSGLSTAIPAFIARAAIRTSGT